MPIALVTGATGSLGLRTAREISTNQNWQVIVSGRRAAAVDAAVKQLGANASGCVMDLASLADVHRAAAALPDLDAVVCNAGVHSVSGVRYTADGIEETFGVNHLAHFALVRCLLSRLRAGARVVFVSSGTHDPARRTGFPPPEYRSARDLAFPAPGTDALRDGRRRYTESKLCNVLAAYEFARRVPSAAAAFTVFDPGQMPGTGIARDYRGLRAFGWRYLLPVATVVPGNDIHTPRSRARALARLLVDPALAGVTGTYVDGSRAVRSSADSYDPKLAADLWDFSVAASDPARPIARAAR